MENMTKLEFVDCHRLPERSFFFKGKQFPLCARCTGIYVGYAIFIPIIFFIKINILFALLAIMPTTIDGLTQAYCNRESNNILRFITGIFAGLGLAGISDFIAYYIVVSLKFLYHLL
ncbi:putative membrane protein [Pedobacter psychrotolerans]|uniref:Putative membrane protein n=2 Tax=Pedobacter psychrotolerans TaxID=1843235 RepID=A0A4R2HKU7_9SPHI|nr:putative membrane protein [Pedobacter psychrotolerans]GGE68582.1 hypothetical protein GCM10011413_39060 [Pedobacter psychrotolerans]